MSLRFRKSIKLAPGVRWNISGGGSSFSFGPRGASITTGKRGTFFNVGLPGTGLSSRSRVGAPPPPPPRPANGSTSFKLTCSVSDRGELVFVDANGDHVPEHLIEVAKKQNREALLGLIERACEEVNEEVQALARIHKKTPHPLARPRFVPEAFDEPAPAEPVAAKPGLLGGLFASKRAAIDAANEAARANYERELAEWRRRKAKHEEDQDRQRSMIGRLDSDPAAMEAYFSERLESIEWPRETEVAFEVTGYTIALDVDLPEIEDMPSKIAAVPTRGLKLSVKDMTAAQLQKLYLGHIHGVVFRLIGEAFAALPAVSEVVASGYSQRPDSRTGQNVDEYLISIRVTRDQWRDVNFGNLAAVDPVDALGAFGAVRSIQRGKLQAIAPL